jgi:phosphoribosylaminoimidazole-succinocarboxamide synthase
MSGDHQEQIVVYAAEDLGERGARTANTLATELSQLGFNAAHGAGVAAAQGDIRLRLTVTGQPRRFGDIPVDLTHADPGALLENALRSIPFQFANLPLEVEGESKEIRRWTDKVVLVRMKPTVYSYTYNRYGEVAGTDAIRLSFTSEIFRRMRGVVREGVELKTCFLAEIVRPDGGFLVERLVETCNLEVRVKRYHIGSPVKRYLYTEDHPSTEADGPIRKWTRFSKPVVCFDWRHPLMDKEKKRLADEPLSDDYAGLWITNVPLAKQLAKNAFLWLENEFAAVEMRLVDICFFIDRHGSMIYGEVSPDCMRVRRDLRDPALADAADKDLWRQGKSPEEVREGYAELNWRLNIPALHPDELATAPVS